MNLITYCKSCKKDIKIKSNASTRPDLQMEKGDEFKVSCKSCGKTAIRHVNEIKAEPDNILILSGVAIGVFATIILWQLYGAIGVISIAIPILIWKQQINATRVFNAYSIRKKRIN